MICPVCDNNTNQTIQAECYPADIFLFGDKTITRHICNNCGLIFGPQSFIELSAEQLGAKYNEIYKIVSDTYTTVDYHNFFNLNPNTQNNYLNIACGTQAHYLNILRNMGYAVYTNEILLPEDGYNFNNIDTCRIKLFNGIFSNNYIEHIQDPIQWFTQLNRRLELNSLMVHSTGCFNYTIERTPFHLYFWNRKALEIVCQKTGFVLLPIVKYRVFPHQYYSLNLNEIYTVPYNGEAIRDSDGVRLIFRKVVNV